MKTSMSTAAPLLINPLTEFDTLITAKDPERHYDMILLYRSIQDTHHPLPEMHKLQYMIQKIVDDLERYTTPDWDHALNDVSQESFTMHDVYQCIMSTIAKIHPQMVLQAFERGPWTKDKWSIYRNIVAVAVDSATYSETTRKNCVPFLLTQKFYQKDLRAYFYHANQTPNTIRVEHTPHVTHQEDTLVQLFDTIIHQDIQAWPKPWQYQFAELRILHEYGHTTPLLQTLFECIPDEQTFAIILQQRQYGCEDLTIHPDVDNCHGI